MNQLEFNGMGQSKAEENGVEVQGKSSQWVERQQVEVGLSALNQLAKNRKKGFSLKDAIATMMPGIEKSFAAGYTHQEICDTLKEKAGIAIAPSTLKLYVNRIRKEKEKKRGKGRKPKETENLATTAEPALLQTDPKGGLNAVDGSVLRDWPENSEDYCEGFIENEDEDEESTEDI
jgi:hypothetical protein